jgi:hypothetical protein
MLSVHVLELRRGAKGLAISSTTSILISASTTANGDSIGSNNNNISTASLTMLAKIQTAAFYAIPPAPHHSITVHLPGWPNLLRFLDRDPEIMGSFKSMYPRMIPHQDVKEVSSSSPFSSSFTSFRRVCFSLLLTSSIAAHRESHRESRRSRQPHVLPLLRA